MQPSVTLKALWLVLLPCACVSLPQQEHAARTQLSPLTTEDPKPAVTPLNKPLLPETQGGLGHVSAYDKVEGNVWRTAMDPRLVFQMTTRALSRTYMIANADKRNLTLSTDWDKFFVEGRLFRNRMNVTVFSVGTRQTEIIIKNTVEYYAGSAQKPVDLGSSEWLPSPDITDEIPRFIDALNQQTALMLGRRNPQKNPPY